MFGIVKERFLNQSNKNFGNFQRYNAFTLAEVLITITIIGIIASLTIPTLMKKVQNHEYVAALKKAYSTQQEGWSQLLAADGVDHLEYTSVFKSMNPAYCQPYTGMCTTFWDNLNKYFKFEKIIAPDYQTYYLGGDKASDYTGSKVFVLPDGSVLPYVYFYKYSHQDVPGQPKIAAEGGHLYLYQGYIYIDVNGFKKPNTFGRDIYRFELSSDGKLYPKGGKDFSLYWYEDLTKTWQNDSTKCGSAGSQDLSGVFGEGCAGRIMEEGWQMNY